MLGVREARALGTGIRVAALDGSLLEAAFEIAQSELAELDRCCSRFRDDSELSLVNRQAGTWVRTDPLLIEVLDAALWVARFTGGAVDPTVGAVMREIGYDRDFAEVRDGAPLSLRVKPVPGWSRVELDRARARVRIPRGAELDLGSTAKAWAADRSAVRAHRHTGTGILVSLGGDVGVAGPAPAGGWTVLCTDDQAAAPSSPGQLVALHDGGLATSSTRVRSWRRGSATMHHIVDPSTGLPARVWWRTASVAADSCVHANAAATAVIVLGERALPWLRALALPARLVGVDGSVVTLGGWPEPRQDATE